MSENWAAIAAEVADAIGEVGFAATLISPGAKSGPDYDPTFGAAIESQITCISKSFGWGARAGTAIRAGDRLLTVSTSGPTPTTADKVRIGATVYSVIEVKPLAPGGVDLLFEVQLRA